MYFRAAIRLLLAALSLGLFAAVGIAGQLLPLPRRHTSDPLYYFVLDGRAAALAFAAGAAVVVLLWLLVRDTRRLLSLCWTAPLALGIVAALPNIGSRAASLAYFLYDLRWCWVALIVGAVLWPVVQRDKASGSPFKVPVVPDLPAVRGVRTEALVFIVVCVWAVVSMPILRFSGFIHGDEPKYIRYIETLYQGQGFDIDAKKPLTDFRIDADSHLLANVPQLARALSGDARDLAADLPAFAHDPLHFQWNRAIPLPNWFLTGKHGNAYQVHTPGLSFLLLPGYYLDRHLLSAQPGYQGEFPAELVMTNVVMLTFYGLAAVALFRLLWLATRHVGWSVVGALLGMTTLPTTSFAFQLYPEMPAAFIVLAVSVVLLFQRATTTPIVAALSGAAVSYLAWLHPRFLLLWIVFLLLGVAGLEWRARRAFLAGAAAMMFTFCAFAYHLTGSWLPTAMYDADPHSNAFVWSIIPVQMLANMLDRIWGVVPHAPILLALPAGVVVLWRGSRREAIAFVAIFLALLIPTASHGLSAAGATPGRQFVAVIPLAFWPLTRLAIAAWPSISRRALFIVLGTMSIEAAWTYNFVHEKAVGRFVGESASGWRPNIAFPWIHTEIWDNSTTNYMVFLTWLVLIAVLTWWLARRVEAVTESSPAIATRLATAAATVIFVAIVLGTTATAVADDRTRDDYLPTLRQARTRIARSLVDIDRCWLCTSTAPGKVDWWLFGPNPLAGITVAPEVNGSNLRVSIDLQSDEAMARATESSPFARVEIDFGDSTKVVYAGVVSTRIVDHHYARPGRYVLSVSVRLPKGELRTERREIVIAE